MLCAQAWTTDFAAQAGIRPDSLDKEAWVIRTSGKNLILSGGRQRGTLYAVYTLLEKHFGCHWLDPVGAGWPRRTRLFIAGLSSGSLDLYRHMKSESEVAQSCPTLSNPMDRGPPGSSVRGILQARVLEWGAIASCNRESLIAYLTVLIWM